MLILEKAGSVANFLLMEEKADKIVRRFIFR